MKFLIIGDIVGKPGVKKLDEVLDRYVKENNIDFVIANGENSANGKGLRKQEYDKLINLGIDVITMGNHIYYRKEMSYLYDKLPRLLIPANITNLKGNEYVVVEKNGVKVAVINLIGRVNVGEVKEENSVCPFIKSEELIEKIKKENVDYIFVDFHAEATAEKIALGYFLEDKVTCVYGTHTHVQTADEQIINNMAYITDVGMTGPKGSVLGLKKEIAVARFYTGQRIKYECSENEAMFNAVIVETDDETKAAIKIDRINE